MSAWAWLGDMELDDTLLGLGAAGIFASCQPLALGFLVNAAHCCERRGDGGLRASEMYREKRSFLDAFFGGRFHAVLDRHAAGGKGRGWVGELTGEQLAGLGDACGLQDQLGGWLDAVVESRPRVLHLLVSGPLLGRGEELCSALAARFLTPCGAEGSLEGAPQLVLWMYAGSFNITHSSEQDREHIRRLVEEHSPRVRVLETTLKSGAWACEASGPFWASACPTAWTVEEARHNPLGFDVSTDIQSVDKFLRGYSSPPGAARPQRGLRWIFQQIADAGGGGASAQPRVADAISELVRGLEERSLATNLTKMVPPDSASMAKLREALPVQQEELEAAYERAARHLGGPGGAGRLEELTAAAQAYAELYRGADGLFLEAGCSEFFPSAKPYSGPRLDKRCILRCMSEGQLQGGPTADLLVVLALLLFLPQLDAEAGASEEDAAAVGACCSLVCSPAPGGQQGWVCRRLPPGTRDLFHLRPAAGGAPARALSAALRPEVEMSEATRAALQPLVDLAIEAVVLGGGRLVRAGEGARWGPLHHSPPTAGAVG